MMHGVQIAERRLLHQTVGTGAVETYPVVCPGVGFVGGIGDQLVGFGQKQISLLQGVGDAPHLIYAFAAHHQVDQVMVPHTGAPGVARFTVFIAAIEDGQFHVVGVALFVRLLAYIGHDTSPYRLPHNVGSGWIVFLL